jgi:hypothetical protein
MEGGFVRDDRFLGCIGGGSNGDSLLILSESQFLSESPLLPSPFTPLNSLSSRGFIQSFCTPDVMTSTQLSFYPLSYFPQRGNGGFTPSPVGEGREGGNRLKEEWSTNLYSAFSNKLSLVANPPVSFTLT